MILPELSQYAPQAAPSAEALAWPQAPAGGPLGGPFGLKYALAQGVLRLYSLLCIHGIQVHAETQPPAGLKIICGNHPNASDPFVLPFIFPGKLACLAQANLFDVPLLGGLLAATGAIPVERGDWKPVMRSALARLRQGYSLCVFPEGRLNHGGPLYRGHTGAVRLALSAGFPIVPLAFYVEPRYARKFGRVAEDGIFHHARWQMGGQLYVEIGRPWWPGRELSGQPKGGDYRRLTDQLMERIAALARQAEARAQP